MSCQTVQSLVQFILSWWVFSWCLDRCLCSLNFSPNFQHYLQMKLFEMGRGSFWFLKLELSSIVRKIKYTLRTFKGLAQSVLRLLGPTNKPPDHIWAQRIRLVCVVCVLGHVKVSPNFVWRQVSLPGGDLPHLPDRDLGSGGCGSRRGEEWPHVAGKGLGQMGYDFTSLKFFSEKPTLTRVSHTWLQEISYNQ